jgi:hypothetical protein
MMLFVEIRWGRPYLLWRLLISGRVLRGGLHRSLSVGRICLLRIGWLRVRLILRGGLCILLKLWLWLRICHGRRLVLWLWRSLLQLGGLAWLHKGTLAVEAVLFCKLAILRSHKTK